MRTGLFASKILLAGRQQHMGRHCLGNSRLFPFHLRFHRSRAGTADPWKRLKKAGAWLVESHERSVGSGIDISRAGDFRHGILVGSSKQSLASAYRI